MVGGGLKSNTTSNVINRIGNVVIIPRKGGLDSSVFTTAKNSLACNNPGPALGGGPGDSPQDIRLNTTAQFAAQKRTVTKEDYIFRALSMPPKFGTIAKAYITKDNQISLETNKRIANPNALNLYTLGFNLTKQLETLPEAAKINLATYMEQYRMLTDAINIKDAFIINFSLNFQITTFKNYNNDEVRIECISELINYFNIDKWQINQPIIISEISNLLAGINGVQTVEKIELENKNGINLGYSQYKYEFTRATKNGIIYPSMDSSIFELKYPNQDINGLVTTY